VDENSLKIKVYNDFDGVSPGTTGVPAQEDDVLSTMAKAVLRFIKRRRELGLTQRRVARQAACSQSYLAQIETGRRPMSYQLAEKLEALLKVGPGTFTGARFLRGRPPLTEQARDILRELRRAHGPDPYLYEPMGRPRFPRGDLQKGHVDVLNSEPEVRMLEDRQRGERYWRDINSLRFDSRCEKSVALAVALGGAALSGVSPARLQCRLPRVQGRTGRFRHHKPHPAFLLKRNGLSLAWYVQICVRTPRGYRWPDNLLVAARNGKKKTLVVEMNGPDFHDDPQREERRDRELGVPVLHLKPGEADLQKILDWVESELERE